MDELHEALRRQRERMANDAAVNEASVVTMAKRIQELEQEVARLKEQLESTHLDGLVDAQGAS